MAGKYIEDLKKDGIVLKQYDEELYNYAGKYSRKDLIKKILASRLESTDDIDKYYKLKVSDIVSEDFIHQIPDVEKATDIIIDTMSKNGKILLVSDYDVDGSTSASVGYLMFKNVLDYDIDVLLNIRRHGNGINNTLLDRILELHKQKQYDLIITSDHGSNDRNNLSILKELNIPIIVTDHHIVDKNSENSSYGIVDALVNPQLGNSKYHKDLTGTAVLYLLLVNVYHKLGLNVLKSKVRLVNYYLTYVGMSTISDCMSLNNPYNRVIVKKMIQLLNSSVITHNAFWTFVKKLAGNKKVDETLLGFEIIPVLNTPGRIGDPRLSFEIMTSEDINTVSVLFEEATTLNDDRKKLQEKVLTSDTLIKYEKDGICVVLAEDANNIQGIISNKILFNNEYKLVIVFSKTNSGKLKGSGRTILDNVNLTEVIDNIKNKHDLKISHGGHSKAIGIEIEEDIETFFNYLHMEVSRLLDTRKPVAKYEVDEIIYSNKKLIHTIYDLEEVKPFGIDFDKPLFVSDVYIKSFRIIRKGNNTYLTLSVQLTENSSLVVSAFYVARETDKELLDNMLNISRLRVVYTLDVHEFAGKQQIQMTMVYIKALD